MRVKSKWHKKGPKSIDEIAGVAAFIAWKVSKASADKLLKEGYTFSSREVMVAVFVEFNTYLIQCAGAIARQRLPEEQFQPFVQAIAIKLASTLEENQREEIGPGDYRKENIERMNRRLADYARFDFSGGEPSFPAIRFLASVIEETLPEGNRWIAEQVLEVESFELSSALKKGLDSLFDQQDEAATTEH